MNFAEYYHYDDFTLAHYAQCLDLASSKYEFIGYGDVQARDNYVLWRHDVDFSMHTALKLAQLEAERNLKATYFIYPHCEFYNLLEKEIYILVKEEAHLPALIDMSQHYFRGGRFYLDPLMDDALTDQMYRDLVRNCFASPQFDYVVLVDPANHPLAAFISRREHYTFSEEFPVQGLRFLLSDRSRLPSGMAAPFFSETSRLLAVQARLVDSGIEMHNLASLKIHMDAGYKFNFIYSAYHSWI